MRPFILEHMAHLSLLLVNFSGLNTDVISPIYSVFYNIFWHACINTYCPFALIFTWKILFLIPNNMSYNVALWGNTSNARVFIAQKRLIKLIFNLKYRHTDKENFEQHSILTFTSIFLSRYILYITKNPELFPWNWRVPQMPKISGNPLCPHKHISAFYELKLSPLYSDTPNIYTFHPTSLRWKVEDWKISPMYFEA